MKCSRCGWDPVNQQPGPTEVQDWPDHLAKPPPLPAVPDPHPPGSACPSPYAVGDKVWWALGGVAGDLPPIKGTFKRLTQFEGPEFELENGAWKSVAEVKASAGFLVLDESTILQEHHDLFGAKLAEKAKEFPVSFNFCVPVAKWPILMMA